MPMHANMYLYMCHAYVLWFTMHNDGWSWLPKYFNVSLDCLKFISNFSLWKNTKFCVLCVVSCVHVPKFLKVYIFVYTTSLIVPECCLFSRSMSTKKSRIYLKCNRSLHDPEEARFILLVDNPRVGVVGQRE